MSEKKTLDNRISALIEESTERGQTNTTLLRDGIKELVQRATFPHEFCPDCDDKMFYEQDKRGFRCINCGYTSQSTSPAGSSGGNRPSDGKPLPTQVANAIKNAESTGRPAPRPIKKPIKPVGPDDEAVVRGDPNVKGPINWV